MSDNARPTQDVENLEGDAVLESYEYYVVCFRKTAKSNLHYDDANSK